MKNALSAATLLLFCFFVSVTAMAAPAAPDVKTFTQPDGVTFQGYLLGDEHRSWVETVQGYTVARESHTTGVEDDQAHWRYVTGFDASGNAHLSDTRADVNPPAGIKRYIRPPLAKQNRQFLVVSGTARDSAVITNSKSGISESASKAPAPVTTNILFILVEFSDVTGTTTPSSWSTLLNRTSSYFTDASYGMANLLPALETSGSHNNGVVGWINLGRPHPNPGRNFGSLTNQVTIDAINASNAFVDYAQYDNDANGFITSDELSVVIIYAGQESATDGPTRGVWGHASCLHYLDAPNVDNVFVSACAAGNTYPDLGYAGLGYAQFGELQFGSQATMGIIAHELGHLTFGLPDLYDYDNSSQGINHFGLMGGGTWGRTATDNKLGATPVLPTAWTKYKLGWVNPMSGTGIKNFTAAGSHLADSTNSTYITTTDDGEYFMVENRQQVGYDEGLWLWSRTGSYCGLAIWHLDDNKSLNTVDSDRLVDLEEADGSENQYPFESDLFFHNNNASFNDFTQPSARWKNGEFSDFGISNISGCAIGSPMSAEFFSTDIDSPLITITTPGAPDEIHQSAITFQGTATDAGGSGFDSIEVAIRTNGAERLWYDFNGGFSDTIIRVDANLGNTQIDSTYWELPVSLPAGAYRFQIIAIDGARNNSGWVRQNFSVVIPDTTPPVARITVPANPDTEFPRNTTIRGVATDAGGSGFDSIAVAIRTDGADRRWYDFNGGFSDTIVRVDANLSNTQTGSTNWSLPVSLPAGSYRLQVIAIDGDRNNSGWVRQSFSVVIPDTTPPVARITVPAETDTEFPRSTTFRGVATDAGGSGFDAVEVAIRTNGDDRLWYDFDGGFSDTIVRVNANLSNTQTGSTNWNLPVSLPAGSYRLQVIAYDGVRNNSGWVLQNFSITLPDTAPPVARITIPASPDTVFPRNTTFRGVATDAGGSGFDSVEVAIRTNGADKRWYDFNGGFSDTIVRVDANLSNTKTGSTNWNLPISLPAGSYRLQVIAFDSVRNHSGWVRQNFSVTVPASESAVAADP